MSYIYIYTQDSEIQLFRFFWLLQVSERFVSLLAFGGGWDRLVITALLANVAAWWFIF